MNAVGRLASAIGYPQEVPADSVDFTFKVDGGEIRALDLEKRLVLLREISREEDELPLLASYSVGRALREDAILYWDERIGAAVLSQEDALDWQLKFRREMRQERAIERSERNESMRDLSREKRREEMKEDRKTWEKWFEEEKKRYGK